MKLDPAIVLVVKRIAQEFKKLRQLIANLPSTAGLPGPPGADGEPGAVGPAGADGADGVTSFNSPPITPSQSGTVNNWNPAGLSTANVIRLTNAETIGISITGITAKSDGDFLFIINASQYAMEVLLDNAGSLSANRITAAPDYGTTQVSPVPISPGQTAVFIYNSSGGSPMWIFAGNIGDGVWGIRQPPVATSVSAAGILSASRRFVRITSASANLKGISSLLDAVAASTPFIWNEIVAWNVTGGSLTVEHEDAGTAAEKRIATPASANVSWPVNTEARFVYDSTASRWRLTEVPFASLVAPQTDFSLATQSIAAGNNIAIGTTYSFFEYSDAANGTITGLDSTGTLRGRTIGISVRPGAVGKLSLADNSGSSLAANRFRLNGVSATLEAGDVALVQYITDGSGATGWRIIGISSPGIGGDIRGQPRSAVVWAASQEFRFAGRYSLTGIVANQNNFALPETVSQFATGSDAGGPYNITGIAPSATATSDGRVLKISVRSDQAKGVVLTHNDAASSAGNRFFNHGAANVTILPGEMRSYMYIQSGAAADNGWYQE